MKSYSKTRGYVEKTTLKMEVKYSSEMSVATYMPTQRHYSEDEQNFHCSGNLKSHTVLIYLPKQIYIIVNRTISRSIHPTACLCVCQLLYQSTVFLYVYLQLEFPDPPFQLEPILNPIHIFVVSFSKNQLLSS